MLLACCIATAGIVGQARAEDEILKLVPEQALGFAVINRPGDTDTKLQELGRQLKQPIPSLLAKLGPDGAALKGFDKTRPIGLLALPAKDENGMPTMIGLIPVSDYAKFLEQFKPEDAKAGVSEINVQGLPTVVRKVGDYAAITPQPCREALEKDVKLADEVPEALTAWRTWLGEKMQPSSCWPRESTCSRPRCNKGSPCSSR